MGEQIKLLVRHIYKRIDWLLLIPILISCGFGLVLISSATASFGTSKLIIVQTGGIILGLIAALILLTIEHENLARFSVPIYGLCVVLLIATLIFGKEVMGNKNWISLGPINIQPSEFVKIGFFRIHLLYTKSCHHYITLAPFFQ